MKKIICFMLVAGFLATAIVIPCIIAKSSILEDRNELLFEKKVIHLMMVLYFLPRFVPVKTLNQLLC